MDKQKECFLTEEQFYRIIEMCNNGDSNIKEKSYLAILLKVMYYCHIPLVNALEITPYQINGPYEDVPGWYDSEKNDARMVFEIPYFFYEELCDYQETHNLSEDFPYVEKSDRGIRDVFQSITQKLGYGKIQLKEVYKLGLENYKDTRKPYKYEEDIID